MAFTHIYSVVYSPNGATPFSQSVSKTGSAEVNVSETITAGGATTIAVALDVSAMQCCVICCPTRDMVVTVNDDGSPDATINLEAGVPVIWDADTDADNPFGSVDVASIKATLASGDNAALEIRSLIDATP